MEGEFNFVYLKQSDRARIEFCKKKNLRALQTSHSVKMSKAQKRSLYSRTHSTQQWLVKCTLHCRHTAYQKEILS